MKLTDRIFYWQMLLQVSYFRCGFRTEELSGENVRKICMAAMTHQDFQWQLRRDIISRHILLPWRLRLTFLLEIILIHVSLHSLFIQLWLRYQPTSVTLVLMKLAINNFFLVQAQNYPRQDIFLCNAQDYPLPLNSQVYLLT